jgi:hypothetical protein
VPASETGIDRVGAFWAVSPSPETPLSLPGASVGAPGAAATVSITTGRLGPSGDGPPPWGCSRAQKSWTPSVNAGPGLVVIVALVPSAIAAPTKIPPSV